MTDETQEDAAAAAASRHGFSEAAGHAMAEAMRRGHGRQAQFDHPELGGMGQWSAGGMVMIGEMGNDRLKARVAALATDLSNAMRAERPASEGKDDGDGDAPDTRDAGDWWPSDLGSPASSGAQNGRAYAVFPDKRRLAIREDGRVRVFDTGDRRLTGVGQSQGGTDDLSFSGPDGTVRVSDLDEIDANASNNTNKGDSPWAR